MSVATGGLLYLGDVRAAAAAALEPLSTDDPPVLVDLVDAVSPPVLMLEWADPWLTPRTIGGMHGLYESHLNVLCLVGRLEPGPGVEELERLAAYVVRRLVTDPRTWPVQGLTSPRRFDFAGVPYLGVRVLLQVPVTIESEESL